jgi:hypothetical protein
MIIGNLLYSNAYPYLSMDTCLIGRAICGLGAPRVINRRYVADAILSPQNSVQCRFCHDDEHLVQRWVQLWPLS